MMKKDHHGCSKLRHLKFFAFLFLVGVSVLAGAQPDKGLVNVDVLDAMRKSSTYMANEVSFHGGYLHIYSEDFSEQWGEGIARKSQIWVQSGTPQMGDLLLKMYRFTGDNAYLDYARKVGNALIFGQHPLGGWHYFIDFDILGLEEWYKDTASQFLHGMEEFRHYYGNCTFDDNVTQGATRFLLHLYLETLDPAYHTSLRKALDFILLAQYPNGGWPQRYPLRYEYAHEEFDDYTSNYTLNDNAMNNTIRTLLEAYVALGNEKYLEAARRGGDFFMIAQGPEELPGWSEQFDMNIQPDWGRTHEPPAIGTRQTAHTLDMLMELFLFTGDRRYLRPVPATLEWMESVKIEELEDGDYDLARYYNPVTFLPIKKTLLDEKGPEGYLLSVYHSSDEVPFSGRRQTVSYMRMKNEYDLLSTLNPDEVKELYTQRANQPEFFKNPDKSEVSDLINGINENGIWIEDLSVFDVTKTMVTVGPEHKKTMRGFSTKN
jgi:PelA/Pel-15E family pectate lyase